MTTNSDLVQISGLKSAPNVERKGLFIRTYGCQMNEYDSEKLAKILESGYRSVSRPEDADLVLVNTCSVRDKPEQKLYSLLGELRELKEIKPDLMIGVGGCVAQQEGQAILKRNSAVDFVFGTHNLSLVPSLIERRRDLGTPQLAVDYRDEWEDLPLGFTGSERVSVLVSISRGCNKNCTYCVVPTTRGPEASRALSEIEKEIRISVHRGAREVVLLGQTVNSWGNDFTPRRKFSELLDRVAAIDGVERIRFSSPHPQEVRKDFIELLKTNKKICRHIHMPLQSGSDKILRAMNRNYRVERYLEIISEVRDAVPDVGLTTDTIVGFPGETEEDFQQTLEVMERCKFQNSYSFMYSERPGTEAAKMEETVSEAEKLRRLQILQDRQLEISKGVLGGWIGRDVEVLVEGSHEGSEASPKAYYGRSSQNIQVNLTCAGEPPKPGAIISARVTGAARFSLHGERVLPEK